MGRARPQNVRTTDRTPQAHANPAIAQGVLTRLAKARQHGQGISWKKKRAFRVRLMFARAGSLLDRRMESAARLSDGDLSFVSRLVLTDHYRQAWTAGGRRNRQTSAEKQQAIVNGRAPQKALAATAPDTGSRHRPTHRIDRQQKGEFMIPIELLQIVESEDLQQGAFVPRFEYAASPAIIGTFQGATVAVHLGESMYCTGVTGGAGAAVAISDYRVRVDPASMQSLDSLSQRQGVLVVRSGKLMICAPGDRPYGYISVELGEFPGAAANIAYCFTRWKLTADAGDETITLIERTPEGFRLPSAD